MEQGFYEGAQLWTFLTKSIKKMPKIDFQGIE